MRNYKFFILFMVLSSLLVLGSVYDTIYPDALSQENISISTDGEYNDTYFLNISNYTVIDNATFDFEGHSYGSGWCYQESANVSTACGGLDSGNYESTGDWEDSWGNNTLKKAYDGDWSTYTEVWSGSPRIYINYTKPSGASSSSLWQVKDDTGTANLSIPQNCFDQSPLQFMIEGSPPINAKINWTCWDGTDYEQLRQTGNINKMFEEAMFWDMSSYLKNFNISIDSTRILFVDGELNEDNVNLDHLSDSFTEKNISYDIINFTYTYYLNIFKNSTVSNAYLNITGLEGADPDVYSDDDTEDSSSYTGSVQNPGNAYDEDWDTYGHMVNSGTGYSWGYIFENYTLVGNQTGGVNWTIKIGFDTCAHSNCRSMFYFNCWDYLTSSWKTISSQGIGPSQSSTTNRYYSLLSHAPGCMQYNDGEQIRTYVLFGTRGYPPNPSEARYYEGLLTIYNKTHSENPYLEVGTADGNYEWNLTSTEYEQNKLNDSSTQTNLTFTGGDNHTVWVNIPKDANVTSITMILEAFE